MHAFSWPAMRASFVLLTAALLSTNSTSATTTLFPTSLPSKEWVQFEAAGFEKPVCGVIYRTDDALTNGMALGGIDTGCIDIEPTGLIGFTTIFNSHVPRRGPLHLPLLGLSVGGNTWVLCKPRSPAELKLEGVETAQRIHYWGHYPVVDMEFDLPAPVSAGLRAWSPFLPGDVDHSILPGAVFELRLRNKTATGQQGTVAFSFPGPSASETGGATFDHQPLTGAARGVQVLSETASYALAVLDEAGVRTGGELGPHGAAWAGIHKSLPASGSNSGAASIAVDFALDAGQEKVIRFTLTWLAPRWNGEGSLNAEPEKGAVTEAWICPSGNWDQSADHIADMTYKNHRRDAPIVFEKEYEVTLGQRISQYFGPKVGHESDYAGTELLIEAIRIDQQDANDRNREDPVEPGDTWDIGRDWSVESNPLGAWEIGNCTGGGMGPPYQMIDDWVPNSVTGGSTIHQQPAWAENANSQGAAKLVNDRPFDGDSQVGDVVVQPWTSIRWISPIKGKIRLTSKTWMIRRRRAGGIYTHMYADRYPSVEYTTNYLAEHHADLLRRTLAWQEVVYAEEQLPVWLRDTLVNILYCLAEDGLWAQKTPSMPEWVQVEDGIFGMNECPRCCPQMECLPCSFYGSLPLVYFFPELQLSTIRAYKAFQSPDGCPPWIIGTKAHMARPTWNQYQASTNGISLAGIVDRFLLCRDTPDKKCTREFYPMIKKAMEYTIFTGANSNPEYSVGEQVIAMPLKYGNKEWFEADYPGWLGCVAHVGLLHLAQARITERMARQVGDDEFAEQCAEWVRLGAQAMEDRLWDKRGYYWNFFDPVGGIKSEFVFGYQMDGQWVTDHHGLPSALPKDRVRTTLETIKRTNIALSATAATNYAMPDGSPIRKKKEGTWDYGRFSYFPPEACMLAMNYMYEGEVDFGIDLARRMWENVVCTHGYTWDVPNIMRGDTDTGEREFGSDYYQDMILWSLPAAIEQQDVSAPCKPGGLVDRMLRAAAAN